MNASNLYSQGFRFKVFRIFGAASELRGRLGTTEVARILLELEEKHCSSKEVNLKFAMGVKIHFLVFTS